MVDASPFKTYRQLYNLIAQLDWHEVFALSHNTDWRRFIETINAYIYLIQDSTLKKYDITIEYCIIVLINYRVTCSGFH